MTKRLSGFTAAILAVTLLCGCTQSQQDLTPADTTESASETVQEINPTPEILNPDCAEEPVPAGTETSPAFHAIPGAESQFQTYQLRLQGLGTGWMNQYRTEQGSLLIADSVQSLQDALSPVDAAADTEFDDAFFAENLIAVLPRSSNSGSVRYSAELTTNGREVHIDLIAVMPEVGTCDMADWLVLVVIPRSAVDSDSIFTANEQAVPPLGELA